MEQQLVPEDTTESRTNEAAVATTQTETNSKSGAESEPETRIAKPRNKIVSYVTRREIYKTARDKGTGGEGRSDSGDQRVNKCHASGAREDDWAKQGFPAKAGAEKHPPSGAGASSNEALRN